VPVTIVSAFNSGRAMLPSRFLSASGYTNHMDYSVGSRIRVKLYSGKIIEAEITAIVNQSTGRKIRISFGKESIVINPEQIIEVFP
jgi:hypothetical protein